MPAAPSPSKARVWPALAVLFAASVWFLWEPLTGYPGVSLPGADTVLKSNLVSAEQGGARPVNRLLYDVGAQFVPWNLYNRAALAAGELPLWNPYNGAGAPHLANAQSGVFSPFNVAFLFLDIPAALLVSALLKLIVAPLFLFLFLRERGIGTGSALAGAMVFGFSGFQLAWLLWPHAGAVGCAAAALFFAERFLARFARGEPSAASAFGFGLAVAAGLVAGHPHVFAAGMVPVGVWILFRGGRRAPENGPRTGLRALALLGVAGLVAVAATAIQWIPFLEYLAHSGAADRHALRSAGANPLQPAMLLLNFCPDALGNPAIFKGDRGFNVNELLALHTGAAGVALTLFALVAGWRRTEVRVFGICAALYGVYAFNVFGVSGLLEAIPGFSAIPVTRTPPVYLLAAGVLVAAGLEAARSASRRTRFLAAAGSIAVVLAMAGLAYETFLATAPDDDTMLRDARAQLPLDVAFACVLVTLATCVEPGRRPRQHALSLGIVVVGVALGLLPPFRRFLPTVDSARNLPHSPTLAAVAERSRNALVLGDDAFLPVNANLHYRVPMLANYDAMGVREVARLEGAPMRGLLGGDRTQWLDDYVCNLFGVEFIGTGDPATPLIPTSNRLGRFYVAHGIRTVTDAGSAFRALAGRGLDPQQTPVVVDPRGALPGPLTGAAREQTAAVRAADVAITPRAVRLATRSSRDGFLVLHMARYPGWAARVDGVETPLYQTNYAFLGLPVPAGEHRVELRYEPFSVRAGAWISLAGLAAAAAFAVRAFRRGSACRSTARARGNARSDAA